MPDQEMIERLLKVSYECWCKENNLDYKLEDMNDKEKTWGKIHILAIIKAMREPTEKMQQAVSYMDLHIWENCIDSILND